MSIDSKDLTIADVFGVEDKLSESLDIPEWGGRIYVRVMSAKERSEIEDLYIKITDAKKETGKFRKELIRRTWVDKSGNLMIIDDAVATHMMNKSALIIERIFEKACEVNGFRQKDVEVLKKK
jgi:hypothetical protein